MTRVDRPPTTENRSAAMPFGTMLRGHRRAARQTQAALAQAAGYSTVYIGMLERGERQPLPSTVQLLAEAMGLSEQERMRLAAAAHGQALLPAPQLPRQLTSFVGRRREVVLIGEMLRQRDTHLVTLIGPGGVGKTRLAIEVARELAPEFEHGSVFVPLDDATDSEAVLVAITEVLAVPVQGNESRSQLLKEYLRSRHILLVLDNFEQVVSAAPLVAQLLSHCENLQAIVTTRTVLGISGEHLFQVEPLGLPRSDEVSAANSPRAASVAGANAVRLGSIAESDAARLFVERARAVSQTFALTSENASHISEICRLVDGLPLALELAAVQARRHSPEAIMSALRHPFPALVGGSMDTPDRQRSLHQTFEWSFRLLDETSQAVFARLSVFNGGCSSELADEVCRAPGDPPISAAVDALVDASLIQTQRVRGSDHRLVMLRTLREFAAEKLAHRGEEQATRERHLAAMARLAEAYDMGFRGHESESWLGRIDAEHGNVISALEWSVAHDPAEGLRIAGAIQTYWDQRAIIRTGRNWLETLLVAEDNDHQKRGVERDGDRLLWRARGLMGAGTFAWLAGDAKSAVRYGEEGHALFRRAGKDADVARAANQLGIIAMVEGRLDDARKSFQESLGVYSSLGDERGIYTVTNNLGVLAIGTAEYARAAELLERSLNLGATYGDIRSKARAMTNLGFALLHLGDVFRAKSLARESLQMRIDLDDPRGVCEALELLAGIAVADDEWISASRLIGASSKLRDEHGVSFATLQLQAFVAATRDEARNRLGEDAYESALATGYKMTAREFLALPIVEAHASSTQVRRV